MSFKRSKSKATSLGLVVSGINSTKSLSARNRLSLGIVSKLLAGILRSEMKLLSITGAQLVAASQRPLNCLILLRSA